MLIDFGDCVVIGLCSMEKLSLKLNFGVLGRLCVLGCICVILLI